MYFVVLNVWKQIFLTNISAATDKNFAYDKKLAPCDTTELKNGKLQKLFRKGILRIKH